MLAGSWVIVLLGLVSMCVAAPQLVQQGPVSGPLTPIVGNLVSTVRGAVPIDLEGFSEDLDQDGFVDPIVPAAPVVPVAVVPPQPLLHLF